MQQPFFFLLSIMSVKDLETNEIYNLKIGKEAIMGRGKFGITSKYVSAKQSKRSLMQIHFPFTNTELISIDRLYKRRAMLYQKGKAVDSHSKKNLTNMQKAV